MKLTEYQISRIQEKINNTCKPRAKIVLVNTMGDKSLSSESHESQFNIYCIDEGGNILWQVSENRNPELLHGDTFCYLEQNKQGEIIADRFSGFEYRIDPETGEAIRIGFHK